MVPFQGTVSPFYPTDWVEKVIQEWWKFLKPTEIVNSMDWILCSALAGHGHTVLCVNFCLPRGVNGSSVAVERIHHGADSLWHPLSPQNKSPVVHIVAVKMTFGMTSDLMSQRQKAKRKSFRKINRISITATGQKETILEAQWAVQASSWDQLTLKSKNFINGIMFAVNGSIWLGGILTSFRLLGIMSWPMHEGYHRKKHLFCQTWLLNYVCLKKHFNWKRINIKCKNLRQRRSTCNKKFCNTQLIALKHWPKEGQIRIFWWRLREVVNLVLNKPRQMVKMITGNPWG